MLNALVSDADGDVVQLVEHQVVILAVAGSSPVTSTNKTGGLTWQRKSGPVFRVPCNRRLGEKWQVRITLGRGG